ncbi:MAG TPA: M20/M25/M40 family metallo-hydrolase [Steroidobacteraceae bacterium]|nr:M20/M25/M40 family metallo-hydrolase [Steroidobacteraceae bacterium]
MAFRSLAITALSTFTVVAAHAATDPTYHAMARDIFKELIEINTTDSVGNVTTASEAMAKRLLAAGFAPQDVQILGPSETKKNLVVRLHGTGKHKPVLLIGHLDVVEARREDWTTDPFKFVEQDGYFYGRGTTDMKDGDAIMVTTLIRLKQEGYKPSRDVILALTAGEETGVANGVEWLLKNHRELVDAEFVLNHDGNSVLSENGKPLRYELYATEKVYADYLLTALNRGGHSSLPRPDNAIYELVDSLKRLAAYQFPFELNDITRAYYERMSTIETGQRAVDMRGILQTPPDAAALERLSQNPRDNSTVRTTCVATRLNGGHANNALPQEAHATVNCRILPGHTPEETRQALLKVLADPEIKVQYLDVDGTALDTAPGGAGYPPPKLLPQVMQPLEKLVKETWPTIKVIPAMTQGASDGVFTMAAGLPTYEVTGIDLDANDVRAHGKDERIRVESYTLGVDFFYRYLKAVTAK